MESPSSPHIPFPSSLDQAMSAWEAQVLRDLKGADFSKRLVTKTPEGINIQPLYTRGDLPGERAGIPGLPPFTRGSQRHERPWGLSQRYDIQDPNELNGVMMADLEGGIGAPIIQIRGGALGDGGLEALEAATEGVDLSMIHLCVDAGIHGIAGAALMLALFEAKGIPPEARQGDLGVDAIGALASTGSAPTSLDSALSALGGLGQLLGDESPKLTLASVNLMPYALAGADRVQLLGIALSTGVAYLRALVDAGLNINQALNRLSFTFPLGTHIFRDIAMLRAARGLWDRVAALSGADDARPGMSISGETDISLLTARDPWVNILRGTAGVVAGALGGAQRILCAPFDLPLGSPSSQSRRLARNTQLVLLAESHLGRVQDAMGGSYLIESLTRQMEEKAWAYFQHLEGGGGVGGMLLSGALQGELEAKADLNTAQVRTRKRPITGVSEFPNLRETLPEAPPKKNTPFGKGAPIPPSINAKALGSRSADALRLGLKAAQGGASLIPLSQALGGEVTKLCAPLPHRALAAPFQGLRDASDAHLAKTGERPSLFLATIGPTAQYTQRAIWIENLLAAGGIESRTAGDLRSAEAATAAFKESGSQGAMLCGADIAYDTLGLEVLEALKEVGASPLLVAGRPGARQSALEAAGAEGFVYLGQDVITSLEGLLAAQGALHVDP